MKKSLLIAALFATAMTANAQSYEVRYEGEAVENGSTLILTEYEDNTDYEEGYNYHVTLSIKNKNIGSQTFTGTLLWGSYPTRNEYLEKRDDFVADTDMYVWGFPQICNNQGQCFTSDADDTYIGSGNVKVSGMSEAGFVYHLSNTPTDLVSEYKTTIVPETNPEEKFECTFVFAPTKEAGEEFLANAGVGNIIAAPDSAPVYYNLNGMKVNNPSNGIYIVKRGSKVTKEIIR